MAKNRKTKTFNPSKLFRNPPIVIRIILLSLLVPFAVNFGIWFSNWIAQITGWDFSAVGLANQDWFSFWGAFLGGVATLLAVWWTVSQTEQHYLQTSREQKKQNDEAKANLERQRKLDVLPLIILQPRFTNRLNSLALMFAVTNEKEDQSTTIPVNEVEPIYDEYDVTEYTVLIGDYPQIRIGGLQDDEIDRFKNNGYEKVELPTSNENIKKSAVVARCVTQLYTHWLINAGKEAAINLALYLVTPKSAEKLYLPHALSLMPRDKIKLYFLVDIPRDKVEIIYGKYLFCVAYNDIYSNHYRQEHEIIIGKDDERGFIYTWSMNLGVSQIQE